MKAALQVLTSLLCLCTLLAGQGFGTKASAGDWEEINFEFGSSVLSDGFPTLIRIADLLNKNPKFTARLTGYADAVGSETANDSISRTRAEAVKTFLVSRGARAGQIATSGQGARDPEAPNNSREGRFINRRVTMVIMDERGNPAGAGPLGTRLRPVGNSAPAANPSRSPLATRASAAPARGCYGVQMGTFRDRNNAERLQREIRQPSLVQLWDAGTPLWRLVVGCEGTEQAATEMATQLRRRAADAMVVHVNGFDARRNPPAAVSGGR